MRPAASSIEVTFNGQVESLGNNEYLGHFDPCVVSLHGVTFATKLVVIATYVKGRNPVIPDVSGDYKIVTFSAGVDKSVSGNSGYWGQTSVSISEQLGVVSVRVGNWRGGVPESQQISEGVLLTIIADDGLVARVWLTDYFDNVKDLAIPVPCYAFGADDNILMLSIQGTSPDQWAGWSSVIAAGSTAKIVGFNLPRTVTSSDGEEVTDIRADGGDYGIEFAIPQDSESVAIYDKTFWLYIRQ